MRTYLYLLFSIVFLFCGTNPKIIKIGFVNSDYILNKISDTIPNAENSNSSKDSFPTNQSNLFDIKMGYFNSKKDTLISIEQSVDAGNYSNFFNYYVNPYFGDSYQSIALDQETRKSMIDNRYLQSKIIGELVLENKLDGILDSSSHRVLTIMQGIKLAKYKHRIDSINITNEFYKKWMKYYNSK